LPVMQDLKMSYPNHRILTDWAITSLQLLHKGNVNMQSIYNVIIVIPKINETKD
jgi:hypothetical protein